MLWLTGLMGLLAVGALGVIDMGGDSDNDAPEGGVVDVPLPDGGDGETLTTPEFFVTPDPENIGTDGIDSLHGTDASDSIQGGAGTDGMHGEDGNDSLSGEDGEDTIFGGNGDDMLHGGTGNDSLHGSDGNDMVHAGEGDDAVWGGLGSDTLIGGAGDDTLLGGWGNDVVSGVEDNRDTAELDDSDTGDLLNGGGGNDTLIAGNDDVVVAGDGTDTVVSGSWITEGHAIDIIDFDSEDDNILLVYEDEADIPSITLEADPYDPSVTQVLLDGIAVANVLYGAEISMEDVSIMPLSLAQSAGMAPL